MIFGFFAFGVLVYWLFNIDILLLPEIKNSVYVAIGTFVLLTIAGIICILFKSYFHLNRIIGCAFILLWVIVVTRTIFILVNK
jgi:hypothetical protein